MDDSQSAGEHALPSSARPLRVADVIRGPSRYVSELKVPWVVDGCHVIRRNLLGGEIVEQFGPFASPGEAQRFLVARLSEADKKPWMIGDSDFEDEE